MTLELLDIILDEVALDETQPETLELPETDVVGTALIDAEILSVTEEEPVIEGDPETETVLEPDADELNDTEPVAVIVVETDDVGKEEEDTLGVILADPLGEFVGVKLAKELEDTDVEALVQPEDDTLPD